MSKVDQRDALEVLTRARLIELAQGFELDVNARSNKDELIDALARSKRASYEVILGALGREELKEICRAHGLSDKGKQKAGIVERILGREASDEDGAGAGGSTEPAPRKRGKKSAKAGARAERKAAVERTVTSARANEPEQLAIELPSDRWPSSSVICGRPRTSCGGRSTRATTRTTSSGCCS
ncbi:SAP domain-containing protein [Paraliomyxa miuraensis]|uniref:SAP domain-containing protein n=1 Tax=Paraliomyxa miuraensis TaxID=376150 RepID=UPI0022592B4F|nr:SAP domain-containing protein [Paraliomyxa miuraensis]MCX4241338.1 SAP domain-containing protein [Paraliomyxa miuraensis]